MDHTRLIYRPAGAAEPGLLHGNLHFARQFRCSTRQVKILNGSLSLKNDNTEKKISFFLFKDFFLVLEFVFFFTVLDFFMVKLSLGIKNCRVNSEIRRAKCKLPRISPGQTEKDGECS